MIEQPVTLTFGHAGQPAKLTQVVSPPVGTTVDAAVVIEQPSLACMRASEGFWVEYAISGSDVPWISRTETLWVGAQVVRSVVIPNKAVAPIAAVPIAPALGAIATNRSDASQASR